MIQCAISKTMSLSTQKNINTEAEAGRIPALVRWLKVQQILADETNLTLVTIGSQDRIVGTACNNTSICQAFQANADKARLCAEFCGKARARALEAGGTITFRCHAGLQVFATSVDVARTSEPLVILGGRAFVSTSDYLDFVRQAQQEAAVIDPTLFSNIKFTSEAEFQQATQTVAARAQSLSVPTVSSAVVQPETGSVLVSVEAPAEAEKAGSQTPPPVIVRAEHTDQVRTLLSEEDLNFYFSSEFEEGCRRLLLTVGKRYRIRSMALLVRNGQQFVAGSASGPQRQRLIRSRLSMDDSILTGLKAGTGKSASVQLTDTQIGQMTNDDELPVAETAEAFPLFIGSELKGILLVLDAKLDVVSRREILEIGQAVMIPLEISLLKKRLSLRGQSEEISSGTSSITAWHDFASTVTRLSDAEAIYSAILQKSAQQLGASRASLLTFDEASQMLVIKDSRGLSPEIVSDIRQRAGEGIAGAVFERGEALLVSDTRTLAESAEYKWLSGRLREKSGSSFRTHSFISFPIQIGERRLGVLNLTDRVTGESYTAQELGWLKNVMPHAAAALDRIFLREQAERYKLMSITDGLTGLLNRRYLEERFAEELRRSERYQYPLSFLMIDVDYFKSYNDTFGHHAGDEILRNVAQCIRGSLRNFDVAARYGGEEFSVILPETDVASAAILAERLRARVEQEFGQNNLSVRRPVTISIGVACLNRRLRTIEQIMRAADEALYQAKNTGRNCVAVSDEVKDRLPQITTH
jgi:diguanylate cyclase (GGDEF)-like protein